MTKKKIPKVYKTTITLEIIHAGEFNSTHLIQLQSSKIISHLGSVKNPEVEPEITALQNSSEEISLREAKCVLGAFWEK